MKIVKSSVTMETCHVLVIGDPGSGKTCLINRFLTGQFIHDQVKYNSLMSVTAS